MLINFHLYFLSTDRDMTWKYFPVHSSNHSLAEKAFNTTKKSRRLKDSDPSENVEIVKISEDLITYMLQ